MDDGGGGGGGGISGAEKSDRRGSSDREKLSSLYPQVINPISTKWTDEKHCLYLNSIEASFIDQLYNSELQPQDLLGWRPRRHGRSNSSILNAKGQSKDEVSSWVYWESLHYERGKTQADIEEESHRFSANQCIRHFWSAIRREERGLSPDQMNPEESVGVVNSVQEPRHRRDGSSQLELTASSPHLCRMDSVGSSSDQNFSDEEKLNSTCKRQRLRMSSANGQNKDQVVPSGFPFGAPRSNVNNTDIKVDDQNSEPEPHF